MGKVIILFSLFLFACGTQRFSSEKHKEKDTIEERLTNLEELVYQKNHEHWIFTYNEFQKNPTVVYLYPYAEKVCYDCKEVVRVYDTVTDYIVDRWGDVLCFCDSVEVGL